MPLDLFVNGTAPRLLVSKKRMCALRRARRLGGWFCSASGFDARVWCRCQRRGLSKLLESGRDILQVRRRSEQWCMLFIDAVDCCTAQFDRGRVTTPPVT
eukprot:3434957-Rhodomonas_salina.6